MDRSSEDALWRSIVENYGDRPDLDAPTRESAEGPDDGTTADTPADTAADVAGDTVDEPAVDGSPESPSEDGADHAAAREREAAARAAEFEARHEVPDHFVPPEPPPLPYVAPSRLVAWGVLVGGPLLLIASMVFGFYLSPLWKVGCALGFVGGFVYLVARMPRDPRDPFDDGARV